MKISDVIYLEFYTAQWHFDFAVCGDLGWSVYRHMLKSRLRVPKLTFSGMIISSMRIL